MINERRPEDDILCEQFGCEDKTHPVYRDTSESVLHSVVCSKNSSGIAAHSFAYDPQGILSDCRYLALIVKTSTSKTEETSIIADGQRWRNAEAEGHIVEFTGDDFGLQHPPSCRPNLTDCAFHLWLADDDPMPPGRYRMIFVSPKGYDRVEYISL